MFSVKLYNSEQGGNSIDYIYYSTLLMFLLSFELSENHVDWY